MLLGNSSVIVMNVSQFVGQCIIFVYRIEVEKLELDWLNVTKSEHKEDK